MFKHLLIQIFSFSLKKKKKKRTEGRRPVSVGSSFSVNKNHMISPCSPIRSTSSTSIHSYTLLSFPGPDIYAALLTQENTTGVFVFGFGCYTKIPETRDLVNKRGLVS